MTTIYTAEEVAKHNTKKDLWMSIHGNVYDLTSYQEDHPGGVDALVEVAGQDASIAFDNFGHTNIARELMKRFVVGKLDHDESAMSVKIPRHLLPVPEAVPQQLLVTVAIQNVAELIAMAVVAVIAYAATRHLCHSAFCHRWVMLSGMTNLLPWLVSTGLASSMFRRKLHHVFPTQIKTKKLAHFKVSSTVAPPTEVQRVTLDPTRFIDLPITSIEKLSDNSNKIIVKLPTDTPVLGLPIGQHLSIRATINGNPISRSYTPTSSNKDIGRLELVIKNYDDGLLTGKYLKDVQVGDKLSISGPKGQMRYRRGLAKNIGMIAGGTGITPMFQLIRAICEDGRDNTKVVLLYANQREEDILLKDELDKYVAEHGDQLEVQYLLSRPSSEWTGQVGRVTEALVQKSFALSEDKDNKVMICGPPGMVKSSKQWLVDLGYDRANVVSKMADQVFVF